MPKHTTALVTHRKRRGWLVETWVTATILLSTFIQAVPSGGRLFSNIPSHKHFTQYESFNPISTGPLEDPVSTGGVILTPPSNFETRHVTDLKFSPKVAYHMRLRIFLFLSYHLSLLWFYDVINLKTIENNRNFKKSISI